MTKLAGADWGLSLEKLQVVEMAGDGEINVGVNPRHGPMAGATLSAKKGIKTGVAMAH